MDKTTSNGLVADKQSKEINGTMKIKQPFKKPEEGDLLMGGILDGKKEEKKMRKNSDHRFAFDFDI